MNLSIAIGRRVDSAFAAEEYDELYLIYSEFRNSASRSQDRAALPLPSIGGEDVDIDKRIDYIYEPSDEVLLDQLLPMYLHVLIYRALLETSAGENGARMVAMDNATTNCEEMVRSLRLKYNKARQQASRWSSWTSWAVPRPSRQARDPIATLRCGLDRTNQEGKHFSQERVMNIGTVVQVIGPVVDVEFGEGKLPDHPSRPSPSRMRPSRRRGGQPHHRGGTALGRQCGALHRHGRHRRPGARHARERQRRPIAVPVGKESLGRIINVVGRPVDGLGPT